MATAYANSGGTGNRVSSINISTTLVISQGTLDNLLDGGFTANGTDSCKPTNGVATLNNTITFDFTPLVGNGSLALIDEAKWYQDLTTSNGTWQWQGCATGPNSVQTWTNIGATFALGGVATQTQTTLNGNTTAYKMYRLIGISGNVSTASFWKEIEFKIDTVAGNASNDRIRQADTRVLAVPTNQKPRIRQVATLALAKNVSPVRIAQDAVLVLARTGTPVDVDQMATLVLAKETPPLRIDQVSLEVLGQNSPALRVDQMANLVLVRERKKRVISVADFGNVGPV